MWQLKSLFLCTVLLCNTLLVCAQNKNTTPSIQGTIINSSKMPIENVNAILYTAKDSALVKGELTDKDGIYTFTNLRPHTNYYVVFSATGFETTFSSIVIVDTQNIQIPHTVLLSKSKELQGVVITANKPLFEYKKGIITMNVSELPTNAGKNALELLEKTPGVSVIDNNTSVSINLRGKQNAAVLIDGKLLQLPASDLTTLLRTKPAEEIESIEIIPNPPAKYDAAGKAGIINIKTKKGKGLGMNGVFSPSYTQGRYPKTVNTISFNYRNQKINFFANYTYMMAKGFVDYSNNVIFYNTDKTQITSITNASYYSLQKRSGHSGKIGLDYTIDKKNTIGVTLSVNTGNSNKSAPSINAINDILNNTKSSIKSDVFNDDFGQNISSNISYQRVLNNPGSIFSMDVDYANYTDKTNQLINAKAFDKDQKPIGTPLELTGDMPSYTNIYAGKIDFIYAFKDNSKISIGTKSSLITGNNQVIFLRKKNNAWVSDFRSNHYIYKEYINAAYISWEKEFKKYTMQLGLRAENTQSKGHQLTNDTTIRRSYTNFFPSASFSYHINEKQDLSFSYSKRITRPDYGDLNPFVIALDSSSQFAGNPYLQPEIMDNIELGYNYNSKIITTVSYGITKNAITALVIRDAVAKSFSQTMHNFHRSYNLGANFTVNTPIFKWWNINTSVDVMNTHYVENVESTGFDFSLTTLLMNCTNSFSITKDIKAEISGLYNVNEIYGVFVFLPRHVLSAGISKTIFHNKGTVNLGIRNIFNALNRVTYDPYNGSNDDRFRLLSDTRTIGLALSYKFGNKNVKAYKNRVGSAEEEKNRTGK